MASDESKSSGNRKLPRPEVDADRWVDEHSDCLYRYALVRVRTPEVAQDLVQDTFLAATRGHRTARWFSRGCVVGRCSVVTVTTGGWRP